MMRSSHLGRLLAASLLAAAGCQTSTPAEAPMASERVGPDRELRVRVVGLESAGAVRLALFESEAHMEAEQPFAGSFQKASGTEMTLVFEVPEGVWGITGFYDKNENGVLDTNLVGMPTEPYAFSNNARGEFGPPSFEQIAFEVGKETPEMEMDFR